MTQRIDGIEITVKNFGNDEPYRSVTVYRGCQLENGMKFHTYFDPTLASINRAYRSALKIAHANTGYEMTDEQIDRMIAAREKLTNRRDEQIDFETVDSIDAMLRDVPAGQDNRVDLLLGRPCAVLPDWHTASDVIDHAASGIGVAAEWLTPQEVAMLEARTAECSGIVEHDDWTQGAWK